MENITEKSKLVVQTTALLLLLCLGMIAYRVNLEVKADISIGVQNTSFSIIQITDTQHLADMYPQLFDNLTKWIAANAANYNVSMVIHTGDIVDYSTSLIDWQNANRSMSTLLKSSIPYCWTAGNHDQNPHENPNTTWLGNNYAAFNPTIMRSKPYWVSDLYNGKETAVQFSYGNYKFLIIDMEYFANSTAIAWMTNLIATHSEYNVIVGTHCLLNTFGGYNNADNATWETNFVSTLNKYPNVFLTLNGHDHGANFANRNQEENRTQIYWDMQEITNNTGDRVGAASARIYSFDMNSKMVAATTYLVYNSTWLNDSQNSFVFAPVLIQSITNPSSAPTSNPTPLPSIEPSSAPTSSPTPLPSIEPSSAPTSNPTPLPSIEPSPADTLESTDQSTQNLLPASTSTSLSSFTSSPIPSGKPVPTAKSPLQTPSPSSTTQPKPTHIITSTPSLMPNSNSPKIIATNNSATIYLPFSGLLLAETPYIWPLIFLSVFALMVIKEKRK